ncbi:RNA polymerase sigma factor [Psychrobium sp. 1_MG-2023]|uniref:RNA polymerase sigma factor n=1 Tax=Psychrobium sp. 1_MG-2023 TaxID=3062624 RepID=UPI000C330D3E|nr:sigma-70 family RNA polymerase sigma factor [Psychrobium sp. 1_MG-2023]MDP2562813.1 sigma-70 family RNA polymerase sigma factor [Psychrobium sp. 1_MG-2023]PKF54438.1 RNA polymerase [Alteromonadales bacterium alter-6D02]
MGSDFYTLSILPFAPIIIKICRAYTNSQEDFEDYYQEVCLQIWRSKDRFNKESEWSTWIYRISLNVCLTYLKKNKNNTQQLASDSLPPEAVEDIKSFKDESINQLYVAIRQLTETDRAVILLYLEEKSYQEIADIIGTNANNIGVRIKRIKQRLTKIIEQVGDLHE